MKGRLKKSFFIMLFLASLFVVPQTIGAKGSDARIDGQYPMGVASDYMLVAGNRIRHSGGAQMSGRFMANSMAFDNSAGFNDTGIWNNSLNTYASDETPESVSDFYSNLWNPAVVINDFTKEDSIKDPAFSNPVASLSTNIVGMWPHNRTSLPYEVLDPAKKRVRFITDTSKKEAEDSAGEQSKKMVDTAWANNLDTKTEDGQAINGLSDLTQFKDNNITKYLTQNTAVAGRSVEDDIQDVSDFYNNLASGDSDATTFSSSNSNIVDDDTTVPQYVAEADTSVAAVVVNIKQNPNVSASGSKAVVAASIDKQKMIEAVKKAGNTSGHLTGMHLLFNFSKEFYDSEGHLDAAKIPYIVLNYKGFTTNGNPGQFTWGDTDAFGTAEVKDGKIINEKYMNEALGVTKGDWNNSKVLWMGSQILNNFTDIYDTDNYPESSASSKRDMAGLETTAAVYFKSKTNLMYGSFIIPHGSFYAGNSSGASFVGGITAANNITLDGYGAPVSPDQNDGAFGVFGRKENGGADFPSLNVPGSELPETAISAVDLTNGTTQSITSNGGTANFDYKDGSLHELPKSGVKAVVHVKNAPDKFGLYYRLKKSSIWHRFGDAEQNATTASDTTIDIPDLESLFDRTSEFNRGTVKSLLNTGETNHVGYNINRTNEIEFAVSKDYDADNIVDSKLTSEAQFAVNLDINGTLEVTVPKNLDMGRERLGVDDNFVRKVEINEISTTYKKVAAQIYNGTPIVNVYNPMQYQFKLSLDRLNEDKTNPFTMMKNFSYQLTTGDASDNYLSVVNGDNTGIDVLNRINDNSSDPIPIDPDDPSAIKFKKTNKLLQNKIMYFKMPYSNDYKTGKYIANLTWNLDLN